MALTSKERVMQVFQFEQPDRVPVWLGASPEFRSLMEQHLGLSSDEQLSEYIKDDFRRVYAQYSGPVDRSPSFGLTYPDATYRTPFGIERHGYGYGMPLNRPLKAADTVAQIHEYAWPDPAWMDVSHVRSDALRYNKQYAILGGDWSPFWHDAIDLLSFRNLSYKMHDDPELVDALLEHIVDYYLGVTTRIFDAAAKDIDIFFIGNDFGGQTGPLIGEKTFRRFILPHLKKLVDLGHDYGLKVLMHCCGGFAPLIPSMIEIGIDGLQALQPTCRGMNPSELKTQFGGKIVLMGAVDTQLLIEGTPEKAAAETQRILEIMKPGGGYICSPSHDYLLPETPVENVLALYKTADNLGAYT